MSISCKMSVSDVMSPQQDAATAIVCTCIYPGLHDLSYNLTSCVCHETQRQCHNKSRWLPVSADFSTSEELANNKAMTLPPACSSSLEFLKEHATAGPTLSCRRLPVACCASAQALHSLKETSCLSDVNTATDMRSRLNEDTVDAIERLRWGKHAWLISC